MSQTPLYPLRFEPIYQYRLWGGRRLANLLTAPLPGDGPIGEAWVLSDREDHPSRVADGPLKGQTIGQVLEQFPEQVMGKLAGRFRRFPLLLKFLDVREMLSVQVHPDDRICRRRDWEDRSVGGAGSGNEEPHLCGPEARHHRGRSAAGAHERNRGGPTWHASIRSPATLSSYPAGTVHSLGGGVVVFEVQQNSDVTFRLYDWNHVDPKTASRGHSRWIRRWPASILAQCAGGLVAPVVEDTTPVDRERLFHCDYFWLSRVRGESPFTVGAAGVPRVLVCIDGKGQLDHGGATYEVGKGDVFLLPAVLGACTFQPRGPVNVLEIEIPE